MKKVCKKCGYTWQPRTGSPKACPRCKSRLDIKWGGGNVTDQKLNLLRESEEVELA